MGSDGSGRIWDALERELDETGSVEPIPDARSEIRGESSSGPDYCRARRAQLGKMADGVPYILVGNVPEDTADQDEVSGHGSDERRRPSCVPQRELDARETFARHGLPTGRDQLGGQIDQASDDVASPRMLREHAQEIASIPGAQADHADPTRGSSVQCFPDPPPHHGQALSMGVIALVPPMPVDPLVRHSAGQQALGFKSLRPSPGRADATPRVDRANRCESERTSRVREDRVDVRELSQMGRTRVTPSRREPRRDGPRRVLGLRTLRNGVCTNASTARTKIDRPPGTGRPPDAGHRLRGRT